MGYTKQIIKGFTWSASLNASSMVISIAKITILSHFVFGPSEFGVFGVGILVLGILELITETGINVFLVQETKPLSTYLDTAWFVSIIRGVLISVLVAILAYPIAIFFKIETNWTFILAFALVPLLRGFINPAIASLQKDLKFRQDAIYRFIVSFIEDAAIVVLALLTHNIFSFVAGILIGVICEVIITFVFIKQRPGLAFNGMHFRQIVGRGKWVTLAQIFNYLFERTDDVVVGKLLDVASLGIYQNTYNLSSLPENAIAQQLGKVTFPIFVDLQKDEVRIKRAFWRTFWITLLVISPFGLTMFFFSREIVTIFLGEKWLAAIPVLRALALFGIARAMTNLFYPVFLAYKKQRYVMISTLVSWIALGVVVVPLTVSFGVTGAAISALIGSLAGFPVCLYFFHKLFGK